MLTAAELREIAELLHEREVSMDSNAQFAIREGYGDNPLCGNEASEVFMFNLYREAARRAYDLRQRCLAAASLAAEQPA